MATHKRACDVGELLRPQGKADSNNGDGYVTRCECADSAPAMGTASLGSDTGSANTAQSWHTSYTSRNANIRTQRGTDGDRPARETGNIAGRTTCTPLTPLKGSPRYWHPTSSPDANALGRRPRSDARGYRGSGPSEAFHPLGEWRTGLKPKRCPNASAAEARHRNHTAGALPPDHTPLGNDRRNTS